MKIPKPTSTLGPNRFLPAEKEQGRRSFHYGSWSYRQKLWGPRGSAAHLCSQTALQSHRSLLGFFQAAEDITRGGLRVCVGEVERLKGLQKEVGLSSRLSLGGNDHLERVRLPLKAQPWARHFIENTSRHETKLSEHLLCARYLLGHDFSLRNIIAWKFTTWGF